MSAVIRRNPLCQSSRPDTLKLTQLGGGFVKFKVALALAFLMMSSSSSVLAFGILGGGNSSSFTAEYAGEEVNTDIDRGFSWQVGGFNDFPVSEIVSVRIGAQFISRTATESGDWYYYEFDGYDLYEIYGDSTFDYKFSSFAIPVDLIFYPGQSGFFLSAGGEIQFITSAEQEGTITGDLYYNGSYQGSATEDFSEDIKDDMKSTEMLLCFGGGLDFPMGNNKGFVWVQYGLGITDFSDITGVDLKSNSINALFGIHF